MAKIICPECQAPAVESQREYAKDHGLEIALYCSCTDTKGCGATFVQAVTFSNYTKNPAQLKLGRPPLVRGKVSCPACFDIASIKTSRPITDHVSQQYCKCKSSDCGAHFAQISSFKHLLNPPRLSTAGLASHLIYNLPLSEQIALMDNFKRSTHHHQKTTHL
ncbi:MAG: ogr/Delta-like zinc finger family protein [Algicola sp.]|nr:ogr/Delta-like zinc finger family protein [Algicola sp.]